MVDAEHEYASVRHCSPVTLIPSLMDQKWIHRYMKHMQKFVSCSAKSTSIQIQAFVLGQMCHDSVMTHGRDWTGALVAVIAEVHRDTNQLLRYFRMPEGQADAQQLKRIKSLFGSGQCMKPCATHPGARFEVLCSSFLKFEFPNAAVSAIILVVYNLV